MWERDMTLTWNLEILIKLLVTASMKPLWIISISEVASHNSSTILQSTTEWCGIEKEK